jgi:hypothetical protein
MSVMRASSRQRDMMRAARVVVCVVSVEIMQSTFYVLRM